jgi:toxin ParE1/3/4
VIVRITTAAEADLEAIADWIARDNPSRAMTFVAELRTACVTLADLPEGYALVPRYEASGFAGACTATTSFSIVSLTMSSMCSMS